MARTPMLGIRGRGDVIAYAPAHLIFDLYRVAANRTHCVTEETKFSA
jgi:hypothetical protein